MFLTVRGLLYPLLGTLFGSAFVFFSKNKPSSRFLAILDSFAAGIMCAAAFFSLLLPAVNQAADSSIITQLSSSTGFFAGIVIFIFLTAISEKFFEKIDLSENMLMWAVSLHNIPEGMAVGVVYAGLLSGKSHMGAAAAITLSVGIALQNIPEGAIISLPMNARGKNKFSAFFYACISGFAELAAAIITLFFSSLVYDILPFSLCFAAGAMFYVVLSELSENFTNEKNGAVSLVTFATGFVIMMLLDTFLG